jgi:hypothetical protein
MTSCHSTIYIGTSTQARQSQGAVDLRGYQWRKGALLGRVLRGANSWVTPQRADEEDLLWLLFKEGIVLKKGFVELLRRRRAELRPYWETAVPRRVKAWERAGWYQPCGLFSSLNNPSIPCNTESIRRTA